MLEEQKAKQQEQAALNHQKLLKYLPQQTAGQSLGMTESAKIAAYNALVAQQGAAESEYNRGINELNNYVREQEKAEEAEQKAEQDGIYNEVMTTIDSGSWNTVDELKAYLWGDPTETQVGLVYKDKENSIYAKLSPEQQAQVDQRLRMYENNPEQIAAEKEFAAKKITAITSDDVTGIDGYLNNTDEGNNFKIGGYKVELGTEADESIVPAEKVKDISDKQPFVFDNEIYIKLNGKVYKVRSRSGAKDSSEYEKARELIAPPKT